MGNTINFDIQGSLKGVKQGRIQRKNARNLEHAFMGYKIDEFQINATITSQEELDCFMMFIDTIRPCMYNSEKL
jgi:hypothetical protein